MFLVFYAISSPIDEELGHNLSILGTVLYIFTFAIGSGSVTGIIIPRLSSSRMRGKIMGFSFSIHWVQKRLLEFILAAFHRSPDFVALLKVWSGICTCNCIVERTSNQTCCVPWLIYYYAWIASMMEDMLLSMLVPNQKRNASFILSVFQCRMANWKILKFQLCPSPRICQTKTILEDHFQIQMEIQQDLTLILRVVLPFANSANPVMAPVAFLASAIGPRVVAACAHASLAALSEDSQKASGHANRMNLESNSEGNSHGEKTSSSQRKEDNSEAHVQWNQNGEVVPLSAEKVRAAAKAGLAAAQQRQNCFQIMKNVKFKGYLLIL
ncbi:putative plastidic glucose transporter 1 [Camellia lanceoleosa]|uniref:Plastidic glucose transporter 1 n=1 Tax=Camellia lanceoleosa TaxID=1840588 RepID=A0ACC0GNA0_9ERIC|nr:putative plastidic glucose transporter 1 [Camellia lanceoleosa]